MEVGMAEAYSKFQMKPAGAGFIDGANTQGMVSWLQQILSFFPSQKSFAWRGVPAWRVSTDTDRSRLAWHSCRENHLFSILCAGDIYTSPVREGSFY